MANTHHAIDYVELAAPDLQASKDFYARVFGWEFNDYGGAYAGIRTADGSDEVGGLNPQGAAGPGLPLVIIFSDDLDVTLQSVRDAGAEIVEGPYDFPGGRRFHFSDPGGNQLAVWGKS